MNDGGGGGRRSRNPLTLGGILSINETAPYRIHNRTLLDLIRDDEITGKDSKKTWKMFREKLRLKLVGSVCTTTVPILASHVHIITSGNRTTARNDTNRSNSPPVDNNNNNNTSSLPDTQTAVENRTDGGGDGEPATVKMSLMALLEVDGSGYLDDDDDDDVTEKAVAEEGGGDGYRYNNCCVCMVRHKGAAFIPCGHTFCRHCSRELFVKRANCPLCNNFILEILDIF